MSQQGQGPVLCIDFGLDRLSVLEVSRGKVGGWAIRDLPPRVVRNGDPVEPAQLARLLKQAIRESGLSGVRARFTLPDEAAIFRLLELPAMPRRHVHRALGYMVDKEVPLPLESICWDWDVIVKTDLGYRICLVAAWRDVIDRIRTVAQEAGLQLEHVEPRSLAIARVLDRDRVVVFDASSERLQALSLRRGAIPFVDQAPTGRDPEACARTLERLLRRGQSIQGEAGDDDPVLLCGDLEDVALRLSMPAIPVSRVLMAGGRDHPAELPSGSLLPNLGLADQLLPGYRAKRVGIADVNLLGYSKRQLWQRRVGRYVDWGRSAAAATVRAGGAGISGGLGRVRPRLAGSEVQSD